VAFKITIGEFDQMLILKATLLFDRHLMDIYMTCKITLGMLYGSIMDDVCLIRTFVV
jgi:hypothetical protein